MTDEQVETETAVVADEAGQTSSEESNDSEVDETSGTENTDTEVDRGDLRIPLKEERTKRQDLERKLNDPEFIAAKAKELGLSDKERKEYVEQVGNTQDQLDLTPVLDEDGNVDPVKFYKFTKEQAKAEIRKENDAREFESKDWQQAVQEFPELSGNERLAQIIKDQRLNEIITGKGYRPYKEVAKEILGMFTKKEQDGIQKGREEAQVNEQIVSRASMIEPSGNKDEGISEEQELREQMKSRDHDVARQARIKLIEKGYI